MQGRIVKQISNDYTVKADKLYVCKARGKFRKLDISPLVGDFVIFDEENNYIMDIKPRKNELTRPTISNVDQAVIIASLKQPDFDSNLLDKLLVIITYNNIKPVIIFTKSDLLSKEKFNELKPSLDYYQSIGYETYMNDDLANISKIFKDKVSVFTGQSGAGKSTLLNKLDKDLNIKTAEISKALNRGKHTTRHVELIETNDGLVADTPGFSALEFNDMTISDIRDNFIEFNEYRMDCKYRDCMHNKENDCRIKDKLNEGVILPSRYENYLNFINKG